LGTTETVKFLGYGPENRSSQQTVAGKRLLKKLKPNTRLKN
jgi:hypothetical protein